MNAIFNLRRVALMAILPLFSLFLINAPVNGQTYVNNPPPNYYYNNPNNQNPGGSYGPTVMYPQYTVPPTDAQSFPNSAHFNDTYERNQHPPR